MYIQSVTKIYIHLLNIKFFSENVNSTNFFNALIYELLKVYHNLFARIFSKKKDVWNIKNPIGVCRIS